LYTLVTTAHPVMNNIIWLSSSWKWNYLRTSKVIQQWHWFEEVAGVCPTVICEMSWLFKVWFFYAWHKSFKTWFVCLLACV
jgi:hypothetical protein